MWRDLRNRCRGFRIGVRCERCVCIELDVSDEPAFPLTTPCMPVLDLCFERNNSTDSHSSSQVHFLHVNTLQVAREMLVKANSNHFVAATIFANLASVNEG